MKNYVRLDYLTENFEKFWSFRHHLIENREDYFTDLQLYFSQLSKSQLSL